MFLLSLASLQAQRSRFVYLQTDDLTPFYVQLNGKTLSSTSAGYLLIGKLHDSTYPIKVGVLGSSEVQDYAIKLAGKDAGFVIKKSESQGWSITDLQSKTVQRSMEYASAAAAEAAQREAAIVADKQRVADSLVAATAQEEQRKKDSISAAAVVVAPAAVAATTGNEKSAENNTGGNAVSGSGNNSVSAAAVVVPTVIGAAVIGNDKKESEGKKTNPDSAVAVTKTPQQAKADSLAAVIAAKEKELKELQAALAATATVQTSDTANTEHATNKTLVAMDTVQTSTPKKGKDNTGVVAAVGATTVVAGSAAATNPALLDMEFSMAKDSAQTKKADTLSAAHIVIAPAVAKKDTVYSQAASMDTAVAKPTADTAVVAASTKIMRYPCAGIISREEIETVITKAGKLSDADEKQKLFAEMLNDKCITTSNLKKIANTLASDVSRYKLFEAAYAHTIDYYAYDDLSSLIQDPYYSNKFKTLIKQ